MPMTKDDEITFIANAMTKLETIAVLATELGKETRPEVIRHLASQCHSGLEVLRDNYDD